MDHGRISQDIAKGLKELRKRIAKFEIPESILDKKIKIATWNIREFGKQARKKASIHFIAEILNCFDLIAITELRANLNDFSKVLSILGPFWRVVYSDFLMDRGGNRERMAYLYNKRSVTFTGLASELDGPRKKDPESKEYLPKITWWRSPFLASFKAGNFDFVMITAHIRWGADETERIKPLKLLAEVIDKKRRQSYSVDQDIILLGDFNIPALDDDLFNAVTSKGLRIPAALRNLEFGSNLAKKKRYDQILHYPGSTKCFTDNAGVLDFYKGGIPKLYPGLGLTKHEFTYQLSDHLPLWIEVDIDLEDEKLDQIINRT